MNIEIISNDDRYLILNKLLLDEGYSSKASSKINKSTDVAILSVRNEFSDDEMKEIFKNAKKELIVFSGNKERIKKFFSGKVIDYSNNESFLQKNAYLTAEAMVSVFHSETKEKIQGKKILVCGYGRIGKDLSKIFSSLGAIIYVYARRNEIKLEVERDGYTPVALDDFSSYDAIFNTVPYPIFDDEKMFKISKKTCIFDLASVCGFENKERVKFALGLPGKIMPCEAAKVIYEAIKPLISLERTI